VHRVADQHHAPLEPGPGHQQSFQRPVDDLRALVDLRANGLHGGRRKIGQQVAQQPGELRRVDVVVGGPGSVTNRYISVAETGFTPGLMRGPIHIVAVVTSGGRGSTARQTACPLYCGVGAPGNTASRTLEYRPSAPITRS
jgi:hypothetical protein